MQYHETMGVRLLAADEDYRAIARAVRGPMRKWWLGVGVWWVAAAVILICTALLHIGLELHQRQAGQWPLQHPSWEQLLDLVQWLTVPVATLTWFLAARRSLGALQELAASGGLDISGSRLTSYRFRLALSQAAVPLVLLIAYHTVIELYFRIPAFGSEFWTAGDCLQLIAGAGGVPFNALMEFCCLAALLAVAHVPKWLLWLWFFAIYGGWLDNLLTFSSMQLHFNTPFLHAQMDLLIVDDVSAALGIAAIGLVLLTLHLLALRRLAGYRLAAIIGVLGTLAAFRVGLGADPSDVGSVPFAVDYVAALLYKLPAFFPLIGVSVLEHSGLKLIFYLFEYRFEYAISTWLFWVVWPIQAAVAAGYIWLIHFVITRGAAGRLRPPNSPPR